MDITLPSGIKVQLKAIVTGYDQEAIDAEWSKVDEVIPAQQRANRKSFEVLVVAVDGKTENIVDEVLKLEISDYRAVVTAINNLTEGDNKKKESSGVSTANTLTPDISTDPTV